MMLCIAAFLSAPVARAQETTEPPAEEVIVNLAAGRVLIAVVKDAILIATVEDPIEADTHPPIPVQLASRRAGVMLGAVEWFSVTSQVDLARLDRDLPRFHGRMISTNPSLQAPGEGGEATDIQAIGQGLLEALNEAAKTLHNKVELPADEPVAELIVADYLENYGPEVWRLDFPLHQEQQHGEYWDTRVSRPRYFQEWPPEKGQPHTLVEFHYPPSSPSTSLLDLLRAKDPRIAKIEDADPKMWEVGNQILEGQIGKVKAADAIQFLRAALAVTTPPNSRQTMAAIGIQSGFEWVLPPPPEKRKPSQKKAEREEGAPTLMKPPS
ncbi:MAG: hypothetical protein WB780_23735 [Candidatus Acidiferrales bacterium]